MKMIFAFKVRQILCRLEMFKVFEIMTFQHIAEISPNYDEDTRDPQSPCYQTLLRPQI